MIMGLTFGAIVKTCLEFVFDNPIGKLVAGAALVVTVFGLWLWRHDHKVAEAAKVEVVQDINAQAKDLANEAVKARAPAARPGAADRLRKSACRDCGASM